MQRNPADGSELAGGDSTEMSETAMGAMGAAEGGTCA